MGADLHDAGVAQHSGMQRHFISQLFNSGAGAIFIPGAEYRTEQHDAPDNGRVQPAPTYNATNAPAIRIRTSGVRICSPASLMNP
jgi:hypothetical protein